MAAASLEHYDALVLGSGQGGRRYTVLKEAIFAHPTLAEAWNNLFASLAS